MPLDPSDLFAARIDAVLLRIGALLKKKHALYGDSAAHPLRIFSKADPIEAILVRIDDKLSRIATTGEREADEDTLLDLAGYLVLLLDARKEK